MITIVVENVGAKLDLQENIQTAQTWTSASLGIMHVKQIQIALTRLVPTDANDKVERAQRTATPKRSFKTSNLDSL